MAAAHAHHQHVVVTGGCGFFGAWIVSALLKQGAKVTVIDAAIFTKRLEMTMSTAEIERVTFIKAQIDEPDFVAKLAELKPDGIIHLAALQVPTCRDNPVMGARVNVIGTLQVFEAAKALKAAGHAVPRIVYASSAAVFGPDAEYGDEAVGDMSMPNPQSHYGAYKLCCEYSARAYWIANGIPSVGLRPLTVYGPGRDTGLTSFPTRAIAAAVKGVKFDIPFTGSTAYIHVAEVAQMFVECLHGPAAAGAPAGLGGAVVYTVGGDTVETVEFIRLLDAAVPGAAALVSCSGAPLPLCSTLDDAALRRDYPAVAHIALPAGIAATVEVFRRLEAEGKLVV